MDQFLLTVIGIIMLFSPTASAVELTPQDTYWLTQNIYWEARNQSIAGQVLVALVTLNRVDNDHWPNTVQGVVTQPLQFSWHSDGKSDIPTNKDAWNTAKATAKFTAMLWNTLSEKDRNIFWYHTEDVNPKWKESLSIVLKYQKHIFYTDRQPE